MVLNTGVNCSLVPHPIIHYLPSSSTLVSTIAISKLGLFILNKQSKKPIKQKQVLSFPHFTSSGTFFFPLLHFSHNYMKLTQRLLALSHRLIVAWDVPEGVPCDFWGIVGQLNLGSSAKAPQSVVLIHRFHCFSSSSPLLNADGEFSPHTSPRPILPMFPRLNSEDQPSLKVTKSTITSSLSSLVYSWQSPMKLLFLPT